jgi:hypothetical protein
VGPDGPIELLDDEDMVYDEDGNPVVEYEEVQEEYVEGEGEEQGNPMLYNTCSRGDVLSRRPLPELIPGYCIAMIQVCNLERDSRVQCEAVSVLAMLTWT